MNSVDVIVPCYRYGHFLRECVESVLAQDIAELRVLVIDDASPDNTAEVATDLARRDPRVDLLRHPVNRGHIATYNEGIEWLAADCMLLLSADDHLLPGALRRAMTLMQADATVGFTFGNYLTRDDHGLTAPQQVLASDTRTLTGREFIEISGARSLVSTATAVVRTELQKRVGGYRPELPHAGDMEMWLRLAAHGAVGFISDYQAVYRQHSANMSLGYYAQRSLLDLQQRKTCFDLFFAHHAQHLDHADALRPRLYRLLGEDAIGCASSAFNDGEAEASQRLSQLALEICPDVRRSLAWQKLAGKRLIGVSAWNRVEPALSGWRARLHRALPGRTTAERPGAAAVIDREAAADSSARNPAVALALSAQRLNLRLPRLVGGPLRALVGGLAQRQAQRHALDDWSGPLIAGRETTAIAAASPEQGNGPDAQAGAASASASASAASASQPHSDMQPAAHPHAQPRSATTHEPARPRDEPALSCLLATSSLDVGGMDEVVALLARGLPGHGIRTTVLHTAGEPDAYGTARGWLGRLLSAQGIVTVEAGENTGPGWIERLRPDIISAHDPAPWVLDAAERLAIPYVDTLHGMHSLFRTDWQAEAVRGRRLAAIVAVGDLVRRQYLQGNAGFAAERIVTIPNGVDEERRARVAREPARARLGLADEFLFVSLARYCLQKNSYALVAAFDEVAAEHPHAHLVIAGRPDDPVYLSQIRQLRLRIRHGDRVHLRSHTSNPAELLAAADGFVQDSFFEGWSLASMEALHAGVPVVLSEVSGAIEQIGEDGACGCLVPNPLGDPLQVDWQTIRAVRYARQLNREPLIQAMSSLVRNRDHWRVERPRLARESAARFDPAVCLRRHARLLNALAERPEHAMPLDPSLPRPRLAPQAVGSQA